MTGIWRPCALGILEILLVGKVQVLLHGSIVLFVAWVAGLVCVGFDTCANAAEAQRERIVMRMNFTGWLFLWSIDDLA
jgi:hypothetical protein